MHCSFCMNIDIVLEKVKILKILRNNNQYFQMIEKYYNNKNAQFITDIFKEMVDACQ